MIVLLQMATKVREYASVVLWFQSYAMSSICGGNFDRRVIAQTSLKIINLLSSR